MPEYRDESHESVMTPQSALRRIEAYLGTQDDVPDELVNCLNRLWEVVLGVR